MARDRASGWTAGTWSGPSGRGWGGHPAIPRLLAAATAGQPERLLRHLHRLARRPRTAEAGAPLLHLIEYVETNAAGIRTLLRAPVGGSGAVEKQVDVLGCCRFKTRGMNWYKPDAAALQRLRVLQASGDWDRYWTDRQQALARYAAYGARRSEQRARRCGAASAADRAPGRPSPDSGCNPHFCGPLLWPLTAQLKPE